MDINLPKISGIECTARLKALLPQLHILMLTVYEDTDSIFQALQAGATGYLLKRASSRRNHSRHSRRPLGRRTDERPHRTEGG